MSLVRFPVLSVEICLICLMFGFCFLKLNLYLLVYRVSLSQAVYYRIAVEGPTSWLCLPGILGTLLFHISQRSFLVEPLHVASSLSL